MANKNTKPMLWGIFAAGGTTIAFLLFTIVLIFGVLLPFDILGSSKEFFETTNGFFSNFFIYIILIALLFSFLWHGTYRFSCLLNDFHIKHGAKTKYALYAISIIFPLIAIIIWISN